MMKKKQKGIINNAFYKKSNRGDTKDIFWSRTQGADVEIFEYDENKEGKILVLEKKKLI